MGGANEVALPQKNKTMSVRIKVLKKKWELFSIKEYMTRCRYVGSYPKLKRFVLMNFLFVVIGFIGWNVTLNLPHIEIAWPDGQIIVEQTVHAKFEANPVVVEDVKITDCNSAVDVISPKYGASPVLLKKIVKAESGNNEKAANKESSARGCFQFIISTWEDYGRRLWGDEFYEKNRYNPEHNVELAAWMIGELGELSHWSSSQHNWK